jgi:multidrug efflux pump subunit AcrA (membrane-fusion protein)
MKKKVIIGIGVAVLVIALVAVAIVKNSGAAGSSAVYSVEAEKITKGDISTVLSANGTVKEVEKSEVYVDTPLKVTKVLVKQNDSVKKGQQLVEYDFSDLTMQLDKAKLEKRTQELTLKKTAVTDTTVSTTEDRNAIKVAENTITSAQRSYDVALKNRDVAKELYKVGDKTKSELDKAESDLKDAETALDNAKLDLASKKGALQDKINTTAKSNKQFLSTKQIDLETQKVAIETSNLTIKDLENKISKYKAAMYSNIDGIATQVNVTEGSTSPSGQPVFVIVNPSNLEVKMNVNEYNAKQIKLGQEVDITGDSIPETDKITGKVSKISPIASKNNTSNNSTETVIEVSVAIDNVTSAIKPGITVNCDIKTVNMKNILSVQLDMLSQDKDGNNYIYIVSNDKKTMSKKKIELGTTSDMRAEIKSGDIKDGDMAVMNPKVTYKDGDRVKLIENVKGEEK